MKYSLWFALVFLPALCVVVKAGENPALKPITPWDDPAYHAPADDPALPRVLLIGDSISIGYTLPVRNDLRGIANVHRPMENCGPTEMGLVRLYSWLGGWHWDVIHFNFGLHDLKYIDDKGETSDPAHGHQLASPQTYEANLRKFVARLKQTGAKLIFATTTPVPAGVIFRVQGDERRYNAVALRVMKENGIAIDDLCAVAVARQSELQHPHDVHFTPEGSKVLGAAVAASIRQVLGK